MVHKEIHGNELYVYMNGSLLYKRWLGQYGMVFCPVFGNFTTKDSFQSITEDKQGNIMKKVK